MSVSSPRAAPQPSRLLARVILNAATLGTTAWTRAFNGDLPKACVLLALDLANIDPVFSSDESVERFVRGDFKDDDRRPISIRALAGTLGYDVETTRRYTHKLADEDYCSYRPEGVVLNSSIYDRPEIREASAVTLTILAQMLEQLEKWGALEPDPQRRAAITATPQAGDDRAINLQLLYRILFSEYLFKFSVEAVSLFENATMLKLNIFMNILRENNIPFMEDEDLSIQYAGIDQPIPDRLRLPTTVRAVSRALGFPPETVRRHVKGLIDMKLIEARPSGLVVPTAVMSRPELIKSIQNMTVWITAAIRKMDRLKLSI